MKIDRVESILSEELKTRMMLFDDEAEIADYLIRGNSVLDEIEHQIDKLGSIAFEVGRLHALTYSAKEHIMSKFDSLKVQYHKKKSCCDQKLQH